MRRTDGGVRVAGTWLAVASPLMILTLALHGPIAPDLNDQRARIASGSTQWAVAHWIGAAGLSLFAVAGLLILTSGSRLTEAWSTSTAWAVVPVAALRTVTTAVAEATVVTSAAVSGNAEVFHAWWAFAEGKAHGFAFLALAVARDRPERRSDGGRRGSVIASGTAAPASGSPVSSAHLIARASPASWRFAPRRLR